MNTPQTEQESTDQTPAPRKQTPGDDGFQSLSAHVTGKTFSPEDLTNRHEAQLIEEFFQSRNTVVIAQTNSTHAEK